MIRLTPTPRERPPSGALQASDGTSGLAAMQVRPAAASMDRINTRRARRRWRQAKDCFQPGKRQNFQWFRLPQMGL